MALCPRGFPREYPCLGTRNATPARSRCPETELKIEERAERATDKEKAGHEARPN